MAQQDGKGATGGRPFETRDRSTQATTQVPGQHAQEARGRGAASRGGKGEVGYNKK